MSEQINKSPWKGLFSYTEEDKDSFYGRDDATEFLYTLTHYNTFVTLYGKSGIGKTSLLQAGLFPIMREDGYTPISVRFKEFLQEQENHDKPLIVHLIKKFSEACGIDFQQPTDADQETALWRFIYSTPFEREHQPHIKPLIILDQFEEILSTHRDAAELLLRQINALVDDTRIMPAHFHADNTFKIIIAIREDDLFRLEDSIDRHALSLLKQNRFRLGELSDDDARCIILNAGKDILDKDNQERIANKIIERVKENDENRELSSAILSLICDQLYKQYGTAGELITLQQAASFGHNELEKFYLEATSHFTADQRNAFEQRLITKNGRRKMANYEELNELLDKKLDTLIGGQTGILYRPDKKNIELIHDLLAKVIFESRQKREAEEAQRKAAAELKKARHRNRLVTGTLFIVAFVILSVFLIFNAFSPIIFDGPIENTTIYSHSPYKRYSVPSGTLHLYQNVMVEDGAFKGNPDIHTLIVGDSCYIDKGAFDYCPNLRHLILEGLVNDSTLRFQGYILSKVEEITLSENCSYDDYNIKTFTVYPNIKKININPQDTNFITLHNGTILAKAPKDDVFDWYVLFSPNKEIYIYPNMGYIDNRHYPVIKLRELEIRNNRLPEGIAHDRIYRITSQDTIIENIGFNLFSNLTEIDYPNARGVENHTFDCCESLTTVNLPQAVHIGAYAFRNCDNLTSINCPLLTNIETAAFEGSDALTSINLPCAVIISDDAFRHCDALESINMPIVEHIGSGAFSHCINLKNIILPYYCYEGEGVNSLYIPLLEHGLIFFNCNNLTYVGDSLSSYPIAIIDDKCGPLNLTNDDCDFIHFNNSSTEYITYNTTRIYSFEPYYIKPNKDYKKITLYVPYKKLNDFQYLRPYFKEVREMSIWQMLYIIAFKVYYPRAFALQFVIRLTCIGMILIIILSIFKKIIRTRWKDIILYYTFILSALLIALLVKLILYLQDFYLPGKLLLTLSCAIAHIAYLSIYHKKYKQYIKRYKKGLTITSLGQIILFTIFMAIFMVTLAPERVLKTGTALEIILSGVWIFSFFFTLPITFVILILPIIHELKESIKRHKLKKKLVRQK